MVAVHGVHVGKSLRSVKEEEALLKSSKLEVVGKVLAKDVRTAVACGAQIRNSVRRKGRGAQENNLRVRSAALFGKPCHADEVVRDR